MPAWLVVLWFISWDVYSLFFSGGQEGINLVAHVGGAAVSLGLVMLFFRKQRKEAQAMVYG